MPEVIDLLTSPFESPATVAAGSVSVANGNVPAKNLFSLSSDNFEFPASPPEPVFPLPRATKRQRLSFDGGDEKAITPTVTHHETINLLSDDAMLPKLGTDHPSGSRLTFSTGEREADPFDEITFSSSAPELSRKTSTVLELSDDFPDNIFADDTAIDLPHLTEQTTGRAYLSERTTNLLARIGKNNDEKRRNRELPRARRGKHAGTVKNKTTVTTVNLDDIVFSSSPPKKTADKAKRTSRSVGAENGPVNVDRARSKTAKEKEREEQKELRRLAKEQKETEKQRAAGIAEVNKAKMDKKVSSKEMILDLPRSLEGTSVGNQVLEYMKQLDTETTFVDEEVDLLHDTADDSALQGHVVRWRRKIQATYKEDLGQWEPLPRARVDHEQHVMVYMTATTFAEIVAPVPISAASISETDEAQMKHNLDTHVVKLRQKHKDCKPIYLLEGLDALIRKNATARNRAYTAAVRAQIPSTDSSLPPSSSQPRRKKNTPPNTPRDASFLTTPLTESLLLHLQITHSPILIHQTTSPASTAHWLSTFTQHISTIPYRRVRMALNDASAAFCMDAGQVRTGDDARDTYVKMLQEIARVTPAMAVGIAAVYPGVRAVWRALEREGPLVLQDLRKGANRDGGLTASRIGPAVSRRLYKVFMARDEGSVDGIA